MYEATYELLERLAAQRFRELHKEIKDAPDKFTEIEVAGQIVKLEDCLAKAKLELTGQEQPGRSTYDRTENG